MRISDFAPTLSPLCGGIASRARGRPILPLLLFAIGGVVPLANADVLGQPLGSNSPPLTLGLFTMTPFPKDPTGKGLGEASLASPLGGSITFNTPYGVYSPRACPAWPASPRQREKTTKATNPNHSLLPRRGKDDSSTDRPPPPRSNR
jgi:hypothetical protein